MGNSLQHGTQRDCEEQDREGKKPIHDTADEAIDPATEVASSDAHDDTDADRDDGGNDRDGERYLRALNDSAEDVTAVEGLDAQEEVAADATELSERSPEGRIDLIDVILVRRVTQQLDQDRREDRGEKQKDDHDAAAHGDLVALEARPGDLSGRA